MTFGHDRHWLSGNSTSAGETMTLTEQERVINSTLQPYTETQRVAGTTLQSLLWNTSDELMNASSPDNGFSPDSSTVDVTPVSIWDSFTSDMNTSANHTLGLPMPSLSTEYPSSKLHLYYIWIPILIIGLLSNALSFFVMIRKGTRSTRMAVFLIPLAIFDEIRLITECFFLVNWYMHLPLSCPLIVWALFSSGMVSTWLLVLMTAERASSVFAPIIFRSNWSIKMSMMLVIVAIAACPIINLGWLLSAELYTDPDYSSLDCVPLGQGTHMLIYSIVVSLFIAILPLVAIFISNIVIIKGIYAHVDEAVSDEDIVRNKRNKQLTLTVLGISVFFLISVIPTGLYEIYYMTPYADKVNHLWDELGILLDLNYSVNFFFYIIGGKRFRKEFVDMMSCAWCKIQNSVAVEPAAGNVNI